MQEDVREARHVLEPLHRHGVARDDGADNVAPGLGGIGIAHNAVRVVLEQVAPVDHEALVDLRVERVALLDLPLQEALCWKLSKGRAALGAAGAPTRRWVRKSPSLSLPSLRYIYLFCLA